MKYYFLQSSTSQSKTVEIINAIGNTWPLILTIAIILFVILNRKNIAGFLAKFNKVSGKTPIGEITIEETRLVKTANVEIQQDSSSLINDNSNEVNESKKKDPNFYDIYIQLSNKNIEEAEKIFSDIQNKENDIIAKEKNTIIYLKLKYHSGEINVISQMQEKLKDYNNDEIKFFANSQLGDLYLLGKNFTEALVYYDQAFSLSKLDIDKANIAIKISQCFFDSGDKERAFLNLKKINEELVDNKSKLEVFKALANLYEKEDNWILKSVALEMALTYNPNDSNLLFEIAYAYSNSYKGNDDTIDSLALLHYSEHIRYQNDSVGGFNNLGVAFSGLKMKGKGVQHYKKAIELGNTLAASNLAYKYVEVGFFEEAKELLNKIKNSKNVHENVWDVFNKIAKSEKEENEKEQQILERAIREQLFIRNFGKSYFKDKEEVIDINGDWNCETQTVNIKQLPNKEYVEFNWTNNSKVFSVIFQIKACLSILGYGTYYYSGGGDSKNLIVFAIFSSDCKKLDLLIFDKIDKTSFFYQLIKI